MGDAIWKIKIDPYDQVLALTQHMINEGISNLYVRLATGEIVDGATKPEPGNCYADENNWLKDIDFGAPVVIVKADYSNVRSVLFRMSLQSGNCHLRRFVKMSKKNIPIVEILDLDVNDWHVTVPVDVGFVGLDKNTPRGKAVAERSAAKGKPDHSIMELLLDLESMSFGDAVWEFGNWGEKDWMIDQDGKRVRPAGWKLDEPRKFTDLSKDFQTTMEFSLMKISSNLMDSNLTSMGFAVMAPDANKRARFEVNNARYMTYPWTNPDSKTIASPGLDGDGRLNYLLYLETVEDHKPPLDSDSKSVLSTRMGNWTDGRKPGIDSPSKFGTFVLSCANFMEAFLIPKLAPVNRLMSMDISNVRCWAEDNFFTYKWSVGADFSIGQGQAAEDTSTYKLKPIFYDWNNDWQQEAKDFLDRYNRNPGNGSKVWRYQDIEWGNSAKHSYTHVGSVEVWMNGDTITFTRLYTMPNSNTIVYEGGQWSKFEYKIDPDILDPNVYGKIIAQTTWDIKFQMQEVTDGGMKFGITYTKPQTSYSGNYSDNQLTYIKNNLDSRYKRAGDNFEYYVNSIRNCLQGQEKFTLPASGVYFFKDPVMNSSGDLVCGLAYNGNPKLGGSINTTTDVVRDQVPQGSLSSMPGAAKFVAGKDEDSRRKVQK